MHLISVSFPTSVLIVSSFLFGSQLKRVSASETAGFHDPSHQGFFVQYPPIRDAANKVWVLDQSSKDESSLFIPFYVVRRPWAPFCPRNYKDHRIHGSQPVCMLDASQSWQNTFKRKEKLQSSLRPEEQSDYEYGLFKEDTSSDPQKTWKSEMSTPWYQGFASVLPKFLKPDPDCPARGYKKVAKYSGREVTELHFRQEDVCVLNDPNGAFVHFYKPRKQIVFPMEMSHSQQQNQHHTPGSPANVESEFGDQAGRHNTTSSAPPPSMGSGSMSGGHHGHHH